MVDDIDKECSREELYAMIDSLRDRVRTYARALQNAPAMPDPYTLKVISRCGRGPEDWERGKSLQRELGAEAIPPKSECETGAGFWDRLTNGKWRDVEKSDQL